MSISKNTHLLHSHSDLSEEQVEEKGKNISGDGDAAPLEEEESYILYVIFWLSLYAFALLLISKRL